MRERERVAGLRDGGQQMPQRAAATGSLPSCAFGLSTRVSPNVSAGDRRDGSRGRK